MTVDECARIVTREVRQAVNRAYFRKTTEPEILPAVTAALQALVQQVSQNGQVVDGPDTADAEMIGRHEIQARLEQVDEKIGQHLRAAVAYHAYVPGGCRQTRQALQELRAEKTRLEAALTTPTT